MLNTSELAKALTKRYPYLVRRPKFLRSALVVEGLARGSTEEVLLNLFADFAGVKGSFIVLDNIGDPAGVVLFDSAASCSAAARSPPASPSYTRAIQGTELDMRNRQRCDRHLSNLIGILYAVSPAVMDDPDFLERSILLGGVAKGISPRDLLVTGKEETDLLCDAESSNFEVQEAVLVRDAEFGDRVGLLVLRHTRDYAIALAAPAPLGTYCSCFPARHLTRMQILDALDDCVRRQPTADLLRSLIPPVYIHDNTERDLHLYCIFLGGFPISAAGGARGLCRIATEKLEYMGYFSAVIIRRDQNVGVLVCEESLVPDVVCTKAHLLTESKLVMYDSSLFAMPVARETKLARRLLPLFITPAAYTGRVVLLTGLDTNACDAAKVAHFIETKLDREIDAVIVHRGGVVLVAAQTREDAQAILQLAPEKWFWSFRQDVQCTLFEVPAIPPSGRPEDALLRKRMLEPITAGVRYSYIAQYCLLMLKKCRNGNIRTLVLGLFGLAHEVSPTGLGRRYFTDRAVLLFGISPNAREPDLRSALMRYGPMHGLVFYWWGRGRGRGRGRGVALATFESWIGAARLLREPPETWWRLRISDCRPVPLDNYTEFIVKLMVESYNYRMRRRQFQAVVQEERMIH